MAQLVESRECGSCSICCVVLPIDTQEMRKKPGAACRHCLPAGGCQVHASRPQVCRTYHCAWRYLAELDETWRPDRSGVLLEFQDIEIPEGYSLRPGLRLTIVGPMETVFKKGFLNFVVRLVDMGVPAFLCIRGPVGHYPVNTFLNNVLMEAVRARDMRAVAVRVAGLLKDLDGFAFLPATFKHAEAPDFAISEGPTPG